MRLTTRGCFSKKLDDSGQNLTRCIQKAGHAVRLCVFTEADCKLLVWKNGCRKLIGFSENCRKGKNARASRAEFRLGSMGNKSKRSQVTPLRATSPRRVG